MRSFFINFILALILTFHVMAESPTQNEKVMLVLDASGSMWGQIENKSKIEIAREAFKSLAKDWPKDRDAGLVVYGHRRKGDCKDIETVMPVGPLNAQALLSTVNQITPKGMTPLSDAVKQAAEALKYTENKATVILISDGRETCDVNPCELGTQLKKLGVDFTTHVIGFDVASLDDQAQLKCLAENTGGQFISAANASELNQALVKTVQAPPPVPVEKPKPANAPLPNAKITVSPKAIKGTMLKAQLTGDPNLLGYVYLYQKGFEKSLTYDYVGQDEAGVYKGVEFRLPTKLGTYTLKWITKAQQKVAEVNFEIVDAVVKLKVPTSATKGTELKIELEAPAGLTGYIYLFAKGKEKDLAYDYVREDEARGGYLVSKLRLPTTTGGYTVKWVTHKHEVLAEAELEIVDAEVSLEMPTEATRGTELKVKLNAPDGLTGYIYLYAQGKEKYIGYDYVRNLDQGGYQIAKLRLPATPGDYVVKWVTAKKEVVAEKNIKVVSGEVTLDFPTTMFIGTELKIKPKAAEGIDGYVYLYAAGKDKYIAYDYIRGNDDGGYQTSKLRLPARPGAYVVKWVTGLKEVIAEKELNIEATAIGLKFDDPVKAGEKLKITLEAVPGLDGYIYLYAQGKDKYVTYAYVREHAIDPYEVVNLNIPSVPGDYVVKWVTHAKEVLVEKAVRVIEE